VFTSQAKLDKLNPNEAELRFSGLTLSVVEACLPMRWPVLQQAGVVEAILSLCYELSSTPLRLTHSLRTQLDLLIPNEAQPACGRQALRVQRKNLSLLGITHVIPCSPMWKIKKSCCALIFISEKPLIARDYSRDPLVTHVENQKIMLRIDFYF